MLRLWHNLRGNKNPHNTEKDGGGGVNNYQITHSEKGWNQLGGETIPSSSLPQATILISLTPFLAAAQHCQQTHIHNQHN